MRAIFRSLIVTLGCGLVACSAWPPPWAAPPPEPGPAALIFDPPSELPPPEGLSAISAQYREVPLSWDPVLRPDVAGYLVESADARDGPFSECAILDDRGVLAWVDRGNPHAPLEDVTTRFYRLRSFGHDRHVSAESSEVVVATTAALPDPPSGLRAYSRQPRSIPLAWEASKDPVVAGYSVERSPGPDGPFEVVAELEGRHTTHLLDSGIGNLRVLYYRVSSLNPGGERGPPSAALRAVTKPAPLPPVGLRVEARRLGAITLAWEPNVEVDLHYYRLLRWRSGETEPVVVAAVSADRHQVEDTRVGAAEALHYALVAVDRDGLESRPSEAIGALGLGYEWRAELLPDRVRLEWNGRPEEGFVGARITRSGWFWRHFEREIGEAKWLDRDVEPGRRYRYVIELLHEDGWSAPPSRTLELQLPELGEPFVEIRPPAPTIPPPDGIPR